MDNQNITMKQALQITINGLLQINVPVEFIEEIAVPIKRAIMNLEQCIIAIDNNEQKSEEVKPEEEGNSDA